MSRVIILVPRLDNPGGVANYYSALRTLFSRDVLYLYRGKKEGSNSISRIILDYLNYLRELKNTDPCKAVVINNSLGKGSIFRDGIYILITTNVTRKIVFFRGWNPQFQDKIDQSRFFQWWLKRTFLRADHIIVLSSQFKEKLKEWGYNKKISIETTVVDEELLKNITYQDLLSLRRGKTESNILYLGNISKAKGVWEIVEAYNCLTSSEKKVGIKLIIAGDGSELESLKEHTNSLNLSVNYPGYVRGQKKAELYKNAHIYVFPSIHGEGMPNSVLEAMAFGLPVITTKVGGIPDFFEDGKMGLFLDNRKPEYIAERISYILDRPELMKQMSEYNYNYAKERFYAGKVAARLEKIIDDVAKGVEEQPLKNTEEKEKHQNITP